MNKIIVYGLGREFQSQWFMLSREYEVVGVSDKNIKLRGKYERFVEPQNIKNIDWDYVYVTSTKFYKEIVHELKNNYGIPEKSIIGTENAWWYINNYQKRREWVIDQLRKLHPGSKILDAGAGNQQYRQYCGHLEYVSQDFGKYDDEEKAEGIHGADKWKSKDCDIVSDIVQIPVEDESFDAILCSEVLEHLKNPVLAIKEFSRILKMGGILILTAPFCSLTHMASFYYSNGFSKHWYVDNLKEEGFEVQSVEYNGNFFIYLAQELIRVGQMSERYNGSPLSDSENDSLFDVVKIMMEQSKKSKGSEECLCFGLFVKAEKK